MQWEAICQTLWKLSHHSNLPSRPCSTFQNPASKTTTTITSHAPDTFTADYLTHFPYNSSINVTQLPTYSLTWSLFRESLPPQAKLVQKLFLLHGLFHATSMHTQGLGLPTHPIIVASLRQLPSIPSQIRRKGMPALIASVLKQKMLREKRRI